MNIDYNNEAVAAFSAQCDEFIGSKLIMSNQKIRMLLRCMAYYDELKKLAYDCRFNFDYDDEYNRAIVNLGTATIFRLPASLRKRVALILCLLLDFDEGRRDFVKFVQDFYRADDKNDSYVGFINGIIAPFKEAVLTLLSDDEKADFELRDEKRIEVNAALSEQADYYVKTQITAVKDSKLDLDTRKELVFVLDNFITVLNMRDAQLIKAYWIGLKNLLITNKQHSKNAEALGNVVKSYLQM